MTAEIKSVDRESLISTIEKLNAECQEIENILHVADGIAPDRKAELFARVEKVKSDIVRIQKVLYENK
jgi:HD superfamily phosphohydrolase YqeK